MLGLAILGFAFVASTAARPALAAKPCYQQVIDDWFDNGRVDKIYPLPCYPKAIKNLPDDIKIYGNAEDEIRRAWAYAKVGKPDPGPKTDTTQTDGTPTDTSGTDPTQTDPGATDTTQTDPGATDTTQTDGTPASDTSGPSSVPVPLIVLGGLAVLLLAAGSASYVRRRMNGDDEGTDDGATPPDGA